MEIPVNAEARISIPKLGMENVTKFESGKTVWLDQTYTKGIEGVVDGVEDIEYITFKVGSGNYSFQVKRQ